MTKKIKKVIKNKINTKNKKTRVSAMFGKMNTKTEKLVTAMSKITAKILAFKFKR